jgi:hypothetical protein
MYSLPTLNPRAEFKESAKHVKSEHTTHRANAKRDALTMSAPLATKALFSSKQSKGPDQGYL